jgi:D-alanyl-D-alanine carboxypeptidase
MAELAESARLRPPRRRKRLRWIVLALAIAGVLLASCKTTLKPLPPEGRRNYQSLLDWSHEAGMPGAILLVQTPKTQFLACAGKADVGRNIPMQSNHVFQIGSITKAFLGLVAAEMHAESKLNLDAAITNWLPPEIAKRLPNSERATLRQLLEHTSGIPDAHSRFAFLFQRGFLRPRADWSPERQLRYAYDQPAAFEPGTRFSYNSTGYTLAGLILDRIAGRHHSVEIRHRILQPLALTNTYYLAHESPRDEMAHGYENYINFWRMDTTAWTPAIGGAAGLASTLSDLAKFIRAVVRDSAFPSAAARPEFLKDAQDQRNRYFLGIQRVRPRPDAPWFWGHSGATPGYHCFAFHQPERDITIVYFGSSTLWKARGMSRLLDEFYDKLRNALFEQALQE